MKFYVTTTGRHGVMTIGDRGTKGPRTGQKSRQDDKRA